MYLHVCLVPQTGLRLCLMTTNETVYWVEKSVASRNRLASQNRYYAIDRYDLKTGKLQLVNKFIGGGTFMTEIRQVHSSAHGGKLMVGFQEEIGKSFHTGGGLSHGLSAGFNVQMTIKNQ